MELYPMIEPFVNFFYDNSYNLATGSKKVALDLHHFATTGTKRRLQDTENSEVDVKKKDGADGDITTVEEKEKETGYPDKLFPDSSIQNGGFMMYLFCK